MPSSKTTSQSPSFQTENMILASVLRYKGVEYRELELRGRKAAWIYTDDQAEKARSLGNDFRTKDVGIYDPQKFVSDYLNIRSELFEFLRGQGVFHRNERHLS